MGAGYRVERLRREPAGPHSSHLLVFALGYDVGGKATRRPPEGDSLHTPGTRAQLQSFFSTLKEKIIVSRLPEVEDELVESTCTGESFLEIHSSRPKPEWIPPRVVRIGDTYFRLEQISQGKSPRPFVFALRRLAAGVPGRSVILYQAPRTLN